MLPLAGKLLGINKPAPSRVRCSPTLNGLPLAGVPICKAIMVLGAPIDLLRNPQVILKPMLFRAGLPAIALLSAILVVFLPVLLDRQADLWQIIGVPTLNR